MFNFRPSIHFLRHRDAMISVMKIVENLQLETNTSGMLAPIEENLLEATNNALNAIGNAITMIDAEKARK